MIWFDCNDWAARWSALRPRLEERMERGMHAGKDDDPEQSDHGRNGQSAGSHQQMSQVNIDNDRRQQRQGQRDVAVDEQQNAGHNLEDADEVDVMGDEERTGELGHGPRWHRRRWHELKVDVQAEDYEDEAQQQPGDERDNLHGLTLSSDGIGSMAPR